MDSTKWIGQRITEVIIYLVCGMTHQILCIFGCIVSLMDTLLQNEVYCPRCEPQHVPQSPVRAGAFAVDLATTDWSVVWCFQHLSTSNFMAKTRWIKVNTHQDGEGNHMTWSIWQRHVAIRVHGVLHSVETEGQVGLGAIPSRIHIYSLVN